MIAAVAIEANYSKWNKQQQVNSDWNEGVFVSSSEKDYGDERLAARLVQIRMSLGLSMEAFAAVLGVSQPTQSRIERAKRLPDALYLRSLREHFRIDINALLTGEAPAIGALQGGAASTGAAVHQTSTGAGAVQVAHAGGGVTISAPPPKTARRKAAGKG